MATGGSDDTLGRGFTELAAEVERTSLSQVRQKRNYDAHISSKATPLQIGDKVWMTINSRTKGRSPKLQLRWDGPYVIGSKLSDSLYRVKNSNTGRRKVVHIDRMKRYLEPDALCTSSGVRELLQEVDGADDTTGDGDAGEDGHGEVSDGLEVGSDDHNEEVLGEAYSAGNFGPTGRRRRPPMWLSDYVR